MLYFIVYTHRYLLYFIVNRQIFCVLSEWHIEATIRVAYIYMYYIFAFFIIWRPGIAFYVSYVDTCCILHHWALHCTYHTAPGVHLVCTAPSYCTTLGAHRDPNMLAQRLHDRECALAKCWHHRNHLSIPSTSFSLVFLLEYFLYFSMDLHKKYTRTTKLLRISLFSIFMAKNTVTPLHSAGILLCRLFGETLVTSLYYRWLEYACIWHIDFILCPPDVGPVHVHMHAFQKPVST